MNEFGTEASRGDGRLARYSLKDKNREIEAHHILLSEVSRLIEERNAHIKVTTKGYLIFLIGDIYTSALLEVDVTPFTLRIRIHILSLSILYDESSGVMLTINQNLA